MPSRNAIYHEGNLIGVKLPRRENGELDVGSGLDQTDLTYEGPVIGFLTVDGKQIKAVLYGTYENESVWFYCSEIKSRKPGKMSTFNPEMICYPSRRKLSTHTNGIKKCPYYSSALRHYHWPSGMLLFFRRIRICMFCLIEFLPDYVEKAHEYAGPFSRRLIPNLPPILLHIDEPTSANEKIVQEGSHQSDLDTTRSTLPDNSRLIDTCSISSPSCSKADLIKDMSEHEPDETLSTVPTDQTAGAEGCQERMQKEHDHRTDPNASNIENELEIEQRRCKKWAETASLEIKNNETLKIKIQELRDETIRLSAKNVQLEALILEKEEQLHQQDEREKASKEKKRQAVRAFEEFLKDDEEPEYLSAKKSKVSKE